MEAVQNVPNFQFYGNRTTGSGRLASDTCTDQNYTDILFVKCGRSDMSYKHGDDVNVEVMSENLMFVCKISNKTITYSEKMEQNCS